MIIIYYFGHFLTCIMHAVHFAALSSLSSPLSTPFGAGGARVMHLHNIASLDAVP